MHLAFKKLAFRLSAILIALVFQACSSPGISENASDGTAGSRSGDAPLSPDSTGTAAGSGKVVPAVVGLPPDPGDRSTYRIGPHDLLRIEVFQVDELSSEERVSEAGMIIMPLIGEVPVGGLTPREAEARIAEILGRDYLQNPQVNIFVEEYSSRNVTVAGAVNQQGVFPLKGRTTLLQAIAMAGGIDSLANEEEVILFRGQGTAAAQAYVVNLEEIQAGTLPDPVIIGDDRVIVPQSGGAVFLKGVSDTLRGFVRLPLY